MNDKTYNGWTNYATWRVNLEMFDGFDPYDPPFPGVSNDKDSNVYHLSECLKEYVEECLFTHTNDKPSLVEDYARAFLSDVNWYEIAKHIIEEYEEEETE